MAKITEDQRRESRNSSEMIQTWETYAPLLFSDLKRLDDRMNQMNKEARGFGVEQEYITPFVQERMMRMSEKIVRERIETDNRRGKSLYS